ncbi:hypothetical protein CDD82_446 [Ophiocordyceps australis]|uniref:Histone deacetylase domain-containing protein n=1 Tax=Ophiocordyceps australis TaxID=1399860 RepID=A0A2C5ZQW4_9HYPO|nr:hypothetical protein CDD82_446 [Ophiocordyceps australis]
MQSPATPVPAQPSPPRHSQTAANATDEGDCLADSLLQLSLSSKMMSTPPKRPSSRRSSGLSADPRRPSHSPFQAQEARTTSPPGVRYRASASSLRSLGIAAPPTRGSMSRRSSSAQVMSPTAIRTVSASHDEEKPFVTANSLARNHLQAELASLHGILSPLPTETIVVLNDAVYGHRYARPRTSRSALSTIVERPERIKATVLGISTAYVRLGGRHEHGSNPIQPDASTHSLTGIPFRIHKTTRRLPLASPAVTNVHGSKWMEELKMMCDSAEAKLAMGGKELQRPDMYRGPDAEPPQKLHQGDLYLCSESLDAMEGALGAVCEAVDAVFTSPHRRAFVGARPPGHHCSASHPSGFCWVNNVHIGIMHAALAHGLTHAVIIDFDLHHGDGSQDITWKHNSRARLAAKNASAWKKTSIGYFSLHDINSYPCEYGDDEKVQSASLCIDNAHAQTIWNIHLQPWKTEQDFWRLYESKYTLLLEKARSYLGNQAWRLKELGQVPKAAIFFSAGFDASEWESAGMQRHQVNVPTEFYARIAQDVVKIAAEPGLYVDGRIVSVLEGGYSDRALASGVMSHLSGLVGDQSPGNRPNGATVPWHLARNAASHVHRPLGSLHAYDASWWASGQLDKLENPPEPPSPPRKPRNTTPPTYCSPTQASTAKVVDPAKMRRSLSGLYSARPAERVPTPPPPQVSWVVAAHELSKLLIPSDRQTSSCRPEDLNAEATKARRDRQSNLMGVIATPPEPLPSHPTSKMALRERKAKPPAPVDEEFVQQRAKTRRKTVALVPTPLTKTLSGSTPPIPSVRPGPVVRRTSRRLSGESAAPGASRDGGSQSSKSNTTMSRPTSAMSSRTQSTGKLAIKKTRTTAGARRDGAAKATSSPKKAAVQTKATKSQALSSRPSTATSVMSHDVGDAMENITSGMRKIRINLITESQREAKAQARLETDKMATWQGQDGSPRDGSPRLVPTTVKQDEMSAEPVNHSESLASSVPAMSQASTADQGSTYSSLPDDVAEVPERPHTPHGKTFTARRDTPDARQCGVQAANFAQRPTATLSAGESDACFIHYQPAGPQPVAVEQQSSLTWLRPNTSTPFTGSPVDTPNPAEKNGNLFRYTSGIPFAPAPQSAGTPAPLNGTQDVDETKADNLTASVWEVPETPKK